MDEIYVEEGTAFKLSKFQVTGHVPDYEDKQYVAQYMFYGRGGGYGHLKIEDDNGEILAENLVSLGADDTFASSVVTGHFELEENDKVLTIQLAYLDNCDCEFPSSGELVYGISKMMPSNTVIISAGYDAKPVGKRNYDDAVVIITLTEKQSDIPETEEDIRLLT